MRSNWLFSSRRDLLFLFAPVWLTWLVAFLLPDHFIQADIPAWVLLVFVFGIDVGHVWSTIFRTYLDREEYNHHKQLLILAPIAAFILSFILAFVSMDLFWRCLAYVAVFHFVKQQFGFMRIYKAKSKDFQKKIISDNFAIYLSMLYPILYWHLNLGRNFEWFIAGDFIQFELPAKAAYYFNYIGNTIYLLVLSGWLFEELYRASKTEHKPGTGKIIWILTTAGNWFFGIVYFNSDFVFTITNVVAHGLPYLALVIFYTDKKRIIKSGAKSLEGGFKIAYSIVLIVLLLAFFEEFLWDHLVYQEEEGVFQSIFGIPFPAVNTTLKVFAVAVLSVPQITHYIIDGFIWKVNDKNPYIKPILLA